VLSEVEAAERVRVVAAARTVPLLFVCDHASNRIPDRLGNLGLGGEDLRRHIAWDVGAAAVAERLSRRFGAAAVFAGFSRLVIDLNRHPGDPNAMPVVSDATPIPGNRSLSAAEREARAAALHAPYHAAVSATLEASLARHAAPLFVSLHSCTPRMSDGAPRPWHLGLSWADGAEASHRMRAILERREGVHVGDNQPYNLDPEEDYTVPVHACARGLPYLQVEFRQDLIAAPEGQDRWAAIFGDALDALLRDAEPAGLRVGG
jgi:predicted N-formylglutamate amidohydrolase